MKKVLLIFQFILVGLVYAQDIEVKTQAGKIVILHDNGTWEFKNIEKINTKNIEVNCNYNKNEVDAFSGDENLWTKEIKFGKTKLGNIVKVQLRANNKKNVKLIALVLTGFGDVGCLSQHTSTAKLKLSDGEFIELTHRGKIDCGDNLQFTTFIYSNNDALESFLLSEEDWLKLNTMKIEMIRIQGTEYYTDVLIDDDKQDFILKYLNCVK